MLIVQFTHTTRVIKNLYWLNFSSVFKNKKNKKYFYNAFKKVSININMIIKYMPFYLKCLLSYNKNFPTLIYIYIILFLIKYFVLFRKAHQLSEMLFTDQYIHEVIFQIVRYIFYYIIDSIIGIKKINEKN